MDEEIDAIRLSNRQKTRLLSLGLEPDQAAKPSDENEQRGDLLCDILRCPLPAELPERGASFPDGVTKPCPTFRAIAGPTLRELLLDPKTDVLVLRRIKEYAKRLGTKAESEVEKDVFLAVYFAAIAAAGFFHSRQITEHSDTNLDRFLVLFARLSWIPSDLAGLFADAARNHRNGA
jgi:hypothetical protein